MLVALFYGPGYSHLLATGIAVKHNDRVVAGFSNNWIRSPCNADLVTSDNYLMSKAMRQVIWCTD